MVLCLGTGVGLSESLNRLLHEFNAHPLSILFANYWSVMTVIDSEYLFVSIIAIFIWKDNFFFY